MKQDTLNLPHKKIVPTKILKNDNEKKEDDDNNNEDYN